MKRTGLDEVGSLWHTHTHWF